MQLLYYKDMKIGRYILNYVSPWEGSRYTVPNYQYVHWKRENDKNNTVWHVNKVGGGSFLGYDAFFPLASKKNVAIKISELVE